MHPIIKLLPVSIKICYVLMHSHAKFSFHSLRPSIRRDTCDHCDHWRTTLHTHSPIIWLHIRCAPPQYVCYGHCNLYLAHSYLTPITKQNNVRMNTNGEKDEEEEEISLKIYLYLSQYLYYNKRDDHTWHRFSFIRFFMGWSKNRIRFFKVVHGNTRSKNDFSLSFQRTLQLRQLEHDSFSSG